MCRHALKEGCYPKGNKMYPSHTLAPEFLLLDSLPSNMYYVLSTVWLQNQVTGMSFFEEVATE